MKNDFLPTNYEIPQSPSNYMKLVEGENTLRILGSAIIGWEYWTTENKPVRSKENWKEMPANIKPKSAIKHFWAFPVYNYQLKKVQILELTQKGIMNSIKALVKNEKWGDVKGFDLTITRVGEGLETEYSTMPNPHSDIESSILKQESDMNINLEALFTGDDPFSTETTPTTPTTPPSASQGVPTPEEQADIAQVDSFSEPSVPNM